MANGIVLNIDTTKSEFQNPMVQLRQGDGNYQSLNVTVTSNGEPFNLTGWTITFMGTTAGGFKIIDSAVTVTNALQGSFTYTPTKAWGQNQGEFKNAYFKFTKADETASGASFRVNVLDSVDLTAEDAGDYISVVDALIDDVKTSMDEKLAETKQTLADTQSQANTVQTNVNDLNTNVNDLKTQNLNIKTTDNTWTGTNTFNKQIIAQAGVQGNTDTSTKLATTRNINGVGFDGTSDITVDPVVKFIDTDTDLFTLSNGFYYFNGVVATNKPEVASNWFTVEVIQTDTNGFMRLVDNNGLSFWTTKSAGYWWSSWHQDTDNSTVVHNTGNETVAGDKTFTGLSTFTQAINGKLLGKEIASGTDLYTLFEPNQKFVSKTNDITATLINKPAGLTTAFGMYAIGTAGSYLDDTVGKGVTLIIVEFDKGKMYTASLFKDVSGPMLIRKAWTEIPNDNSTIVHKTGTEVINGDKTFMSGSYGLRVTSSGVQKTSNGGITWTNI